MKNNNVALYISIIIASIVAGCTSWEGPEGSGSTTPISARFDSNTAFRGCIADRGKQRAELLRTIGIGVEAETTEVRVSYRDSVQLICDQSDRRETDHESRSMTREECTRLLAPDGIPADANGTVRTETEAPAPTADPRLVALMAANPALFTDDHATCIAISRGNGVPYTGGMAIGGQVRGVGGMGIMPGVLGLSGNATRNIEIVTQGMNPRVTAVVSFVSDPTNDPNRPAPPVPGGLQLTSLDGVTLVSVPDGYDYHVNVTCLVNGVMVRGPLSHPAEFAKVRPTGERVRVNAFCGRRRG
jgi:hypothetical protein